MNTFRKGYRELSDEEKTLIANVKNAADMLLQQIDLVAGGREKALAITKLEESVMWAVKGITG